MTNIEIGTKIYASVIRPGMTRPVPTCPDTCPACGMDLKAEGYPQTHRTDEGDECSYQWAPGNPFDYDEV